jgi:tryptophan 2,3-dioxygenase
MIRSGILKCLAKRVDSLKRITRLNKVLVTIAKVMETIGHRTMDAFKKHNCEKKSFQSELFKEFSQGI